MKKGNDYAVIILFFIGLLILCLGILAILKG